MDSGQGTRDEAESGMTTAPAEITAEVAPQVLDNSEELEALRAKLAEHEQAKADADAAKLSAEEKAQRELSKIKEETAQLKRAASFLKAGIAEDFYLLLEEYRTLGEGDPSKLAAKFQKVMARIQKDAATSGVVGARVNPTSSGDESGTGAGTKKDKASWDALYFARPGK